MIGYLLKDIEVSLVCSCNVLQVQWLLTWLQRVHVLWPCCPLHVSVLFVSWCFHLSIGTVPTMSVLSKAFYAANMLSHCIPFVITFTVFGRSMNINFAHYCLFLCGVGFHVLPRPLTGEAANFSKPSQLWDVYRLECVVRNILLLMRQPCAADNVGIKEKVQWDIFCWIRASIAFCEVCSVWHFCGQKSGMKFGILLYQIKRKSPLFDKSWEKFCKCLMCKFLNTNSMQVCSLTGK